MAAFMKHSFPTLLLLAGLAGSAAAQTDARSSTGTAKVAETAAEAPQASQADSANAAPTKAPANTGDPGGNGKWVPRINKTTCPKGSEEYIDEVNGGVKCWVNTN
jgi:hypothetical protein